MKPKLKEQVEVNKIGWFALQHKDGWWVGNDKGVLCYSTMHLAKAAKTIAWLREGRGSSPATYQINTFTGADKQAGEHTPKHAALKAMQHYEKYGSPPK